MTLTIEQVRDTRFHLARRNGYDPADVDTFVDKVDLAKEVLRAGGFTVGKTNVVAVEVPDRSDGLASVLKVVHQADPNVEYMYAFVNKSGSNAVLIFRFDDMDRAIEILQQAGFALLTGAQICAL